MSRNAHERVPSLPEGDDGEVRVALAEHPFCEGFDAPHVDLLARMTGRVTVPTGEFLLRRRRDAETLFLLTDGDVALEIDQPGQETLVLETLHAGDTLGWSWLYPPHIWHWDARATTDVSALAVDATALRRTFTADTAFGLAVTWRVGTIVIDRLHHTRAQLTSLHLP